MLFKNKFKLACLSLALICSHALTAAAQATPPTRVDLAELRKDAEAKVARSLGVPQGTLHLKHIWYVDLAVDTESVYAVDRSRIMVVFDLPDSMVSSFPGFQAAETYGLNGIEETILVLDQVPRYAQKSSIYMVQEGLDLTKEIQSIQDRFSDAEISYLKNVSVVTASAPDLMKFLSVHKSLEKVAGLTFSQISFESYRMPYFLSAPVDLGVASKSTVIDIEALRSATKKLKDEGTAFYTQTSLPKPFGYGPFPGLSLKNLLISTTAIDSNELEKLADRLPPYGIKVESISKNTGIIVGSYLANSEAPLEDLRKNEKSISAIEFSGGGGSISKLKK
jgi:hypothetical protein